tara:strand:- start:1141 stop:1650 length:510 start_codon:yes stop_codon:yes gene_type:complete
MTLFIVAHSTMILCYLVISFFIWRGWKDNRLEKQFNVALRNSAIAMAEDMQDQIDRNEKLVAEAKSQVAAAMAAVTADMSYPKRPAAAPGDIDMLNDPAMLATILTAVVMKYGDMRLGMEDMGPIDGNDYVSVYVDTATKEMVLSTKHDLEGDVSFPNFGVPGDDETYH